jgi:hypothetical protein
MYGKRSKCAGLAQEIGFSAAGWLWLVKGATEL